MNPLKRAKRSLKSNAYFKSGLTLRKTINVNLMTKAIRINISVNGVPGRIIKSVPSLIFKRGAARQRNQPTPIISPVNIEIAPQRGNASSLITSLAPKKRKINGNRKRQLTFISLSFNAIIPLAVRKISKIQTHKEGPVRMLNNDILCTMVFDSIKILYDVRKIFRKKNTSTN
ncbi:hypothetical protein [Candidatus Bartonella washoeensis]|uniref:hypothetical protein n=1 Tax=Candidatus Bartonella washoeensis TaxID=186739 RepID=UPI0018FEC9A5|nr:hypothetical protein [Bartonella washoeensis]